MDCLNISPENNIETLKCNLNNGISSTKSDESLYIEIQYHYFGARYYDSDLSIWLSVDPLASKYPSLSPYVYAANNPIRYIDPNGMSIDGWEINQQSKSVNQINTDGGNNTQFINARGVTQKQNMSTDDFIKHAQSQGYTVNTSSQTFDPINQLNDTSLGSWEEGMSTNVALNGKMYVVPTDKNHYVDVMDGDLKNNFEDTYRKQRNIQGKYWSPISDIRGFETFMGVTATPVSISVISSVSKLTPYPIFQMPGANEIFNNATNKHQDKLIRYYKQYGIIR